jgi:hypothetical protein
MTEVRRRAGWLLGLHSITSSARSRNDSGIKSPSVLAVLRLIAVRNLLAARWANQPAFPLAEYDGSDHTGIGLAIRKEMS